MNMLQLINLIKNGNGKDFTLNLLQEQSKNNPILANVTQLIKENKTSEIEEIARNLAKEKGLDYDTEFTNFKRMLGINK